MRPTTDQTLYPIDMVGTVVDEVERPIVTRAWRLAEIVEGDSTVIGVEGAGAGAVHPGAARRASMVGLVTRETATTFRPPATVSSSGTTRRCSTASPA